MHHLDRLLVAQEHMDSLRREAKANRLIAHARRSTARRASPRLRIAHVPQRLRLQVRGTIVDDA